MANEKEDKKEMTNEELMRRKVEIFFKQGTLVHVTLFNKKFYNGEIIQPINHDYFMIDDRMLGLLPVFFIQVFDIEPNEAKK